MLEIRSIRLKLSNVHGLDTDLCALIERQRIEADYWNTNEELAKKYENHEED